MRFTSVVVALTALTVLSGTGVRADKCTTCLVSRYWNIDPELYKNSSKLEDFPETAALKTLLPDAGDLGIAFSGGGTRSAAATLGQLRGLRDSGWLPRVRYMAAVSGGSWSAIPFTFSPLDLDDLLGKPEEPGQLTLKMLADEDEDDDDDQDGDEGPTHGKLARAIAHSSLIPGASLEIGQQLSQSRLNDEYQKIAAQVFRRLNGPDAGRGEKTYSRLLNRIFIKPLVSDPLALGAAAPPLFSWTRDSVKDIADINVEVRGVARLNPVSFAIAAKDRPFLIALGAIVVKDEKGGFPQLVPVEYTPLYVGARQQFGPNVGGTYVSPFAYDAAQAMFERADTATKGATGVISIGPATATSTFSLADVAASSGAAPQLHLLVDNLNQRVDPLLRRGAGFFPNYRNIAVRLGATNTAGATDVMPHGDGGFVDNLGLLPLLARHVRNVIVFVNGLMDHRLETQLSSYFWPVGDTGGGGSKRLNAVFASEHWKELLDGLDAAIATGGPQVYCNDPKKPWKVNENSFYNVQPYDGVNICWVYMADPRKPAENPGASKWRAKLNDDVRKALFGDPKKELKVNYVKEFRRFPWFKTFEENAPSVIDLKGRQVNVLANFTSWMITNEETQKKFRETFGITPVLRR